MPYTDTLFQPETYWWLHEYHIADIWNMGLSGRGIRIAVPDSGISLPHPDLSIDRSHVLDMTVNSTDGADRSGHGTHCAGIISASFNGFGTTGIAYNAEIYALKVLDNRQGYKSSFLIKAIDKAIELNVDILSISQAAKGKDELLDKAIEDAIGQGIVVVCAAGNTADGDYYPALSHDDVISVAAVNRSDIPLLTQQQTRRDIFAPGAEIESTSLNGSYKTLSGSSQAAPYVAGVCALMMEQMKKKGLNYTPRLIKNRLLRDSGAGTPPVIDPLRIINNI